MSVIEGVLDGLGPAFRVAAGSTLDDLVAGLVSELDTTAALMAIGPGGWAALYDLDTTPQPKWLGAATGTVVPAGLTLEQQRAYVRDRANWRRGSLDAMAAAINTLLDSPTRVGFIERTAADGGPNAWHLQIRVYDTGTDTTEAEILAAAATQKPVGLVIDGVEFVPAVTYADLATLYADYADLAGDWGYPLTLEDDIPGVRWWRPAANVTRYARLRALAPTYADSLVLFPTYREARDHDPQES